MKTLPGGPKALLALILNLGLGNLLLLAYHTGLTAHVCLSVACIGILTAGFQKAATRKKGWQAALSGLVSTLLIPFVGMFFVGLITSLEFGEFSAANMLESGLVIGVLLGVMGGWAFTPPFLLINMSLFYRHWRTSHRA